MLRLLTLNLGNDAAGHGEWPVRAARVAAHARDTDAVLLQAVPAGLDKLSGLLPDLTHMVRSGDGGTAILTRAAAAARVTPLSRRDGFDDTNARWLTVVTIDLEGRPLTLASAHFSWVAEQAADNLRESIAALGEGDAVLAGDLNQPPGSALWQALSAAGWTDAWGDTPGGETFETGRLFTRIDYVWTRGAVRAARPDVIGGDGDAALSNHRGLTTAVSW